MTVTFASGGYVRLTLAPRLTSILDALSSKLYSSFGISPPLAHR
jgi:hypothetical protein